MSRDWFDVAIASKDNELKKARKKLMYWRRRCEKNALVSIKYEDLQKEPLQECHDLHVSTV